jgi:hypothetical protein
MIVGHVAIVKLQDASCRAAPDQRIGQREDDEIINRQRDRRVDRLAGIVRLMADIDVDIVARPFRSIMQWPRPHLPDRDQSISCFVSAEILWLPNRSRFRSEFKAVTRGGEDVGAVLSGGRWFGCARSCGRVRVLGYLRRDVWRVVSSCSCPMVQSDFNGGTSIMYGRSASSPALMSLKTGLPLSAIVSLALSLERGAV